MRPIRPAPRSARRACRPVHPAPRSFLASPGCVTEVNDSAVICVVQGESCISALHSLNLCRMSSTGPNAPYSAPTLSAVAKLAGVSSITVSRVVRLPNLVAPETRGRVEAAMRQLGYVPNLVAGSLASARTRSVGVLVPTIANSIFADTVQGLSDELEPLGYAVILAQSRYDAVREDHMLAALLSRRPEAIIMVGSPATDDGARLLRRAGIPVVETWDLPDDPIDAVAGFDNYAAGAAVARHLVAQGRRQLAFIGGDDPRATRRWSGFRDVALASGAKLPRRLILERNASGSVVALADLPDVD